MVLECLGRYSLEKSMIPFQLFKYRNGILNVELGE